MEKISKEEGLRRIKERRDNRVAQDQPAIELKDIKKNLKLHNALHAIITINNTVMEKMKKDYYKGMENALKEYENRPIIFAPNHVRMQDIEVQMEACPYHQVLLSGDYENVHGSLPGFLLEKNGIIYFDMKDKQDRKNVSSVIADVLNSNLNVLWYFEGAWCLSPNKPYGDGSYQIVQTAIDTNAIVVPIAFDMIDHKTAVIKYAEPIDYRALYGEEKLTHREKIEALDKLKGLIGTTVFKIWEDYNYTERDELVEKYAPESRSYPTPEEAFSFQPPHKYGTLHKYWDEYLEKILSEWNFTEEEIEEKRFKANDGVPQEEVFSHLYTMKPNKNNAFLFSKRNHH